MRGRVQGIGHGEIATRCSLYERPGYWLRDDVQSHGAGSAYDLRCDIVGAREVRAASDWRAAAAAAATGYEIHGKGSTCKRSSHHVVCLFLGAIKEEGNRQPEAGHDNRIREEKTPVQPERRGEGEISA